VIGNASAKPWDSDSNGVIVRLNSGAIPEEKLASYKEALEKRLTITKD